MNSKAWVLVTGVAGFIGSHVAEALLKKGFRIVGVDNFDSFYSKQVKEKNLVEIQKTSKQCGLQFRFINKDINDNIKSEFEKDSLISVIHLAGKAGVRPSLIDPEGYFRANVNGTIQILELAKSQGNIPVIFGSSSSVYGDDTQVPFQETQAAVKPVSPYAASKRSAELICHSYSHLYGMRIAMLRFFTVFGPRQRPDLAIHKFAKLIEEGKQIEMYGDGSTSRDYTFCSDIVEGVLAAEDWIKEAPKGTSEIFNLGGSQPVSLNNLVRAVEEALGKKAIIKIMEKQPGDVERTFADISKARQILGYAPKTNLSNGLVQFVNWMRG